MKKTNAALLAEISRMEIEVAKYNRMYTETHTQLSQATKIMVELRVTLEWQKQLNEKLISAVVNFSGGKMVLR